LSSRVSDNSQVLFNRNPINRVQSVAPFLTIDERPYPVVVDGQINWIIDAYTTTSNYPYSQHVNLKSATSDSVTGAKSASINALANKKVNYMRNSVKAVVNAFTGKVTLYVADATDPILQAWMSVYSNDYKPISEMSADLLSHVKYPKSLFKVQRQVLTTYHVTDANAYYSGQDFWKIPTDPTVKDNSNIPSYYLNMQNIENDDSKVAYTQFTPFIPYGAGSNSRNVLSGYLTVDSDNTSNNFGQLTLIKMPQETTLPGPGQVQNLFNSDPKVQQTLRLLRDGGSQIINGNLLTIPYKGSFLYAEPVYVQSAYGTQYPTLKKVLTYYNGKVGFANTLIESLSQVINN
jgi:uncharacterized membrane protein (UPF0182 family)